MRIAYLQGERQPLLGPNDAAVTFGSGGVTNIKSVLYFFCYLYSLQRLRSLASSVRVNCEVNSKVNS